MQTGREGRSRLPLQRRGCLGGGKAAGACATAYVCVPARAIPTGFHAMTDAFSKVYGHCKPYAITGSLPCIRELQDAGYDGAPVLAMLCPSQSLPAPAHRAPPATAALALCNCPSAMQTLPRAVPTRPHPQSSASASAC
jgi:hypothetical protein